MLLTTNGKTSEFQLAPTKLLYERDGTQTGISYDVISNSKSVGRLNINGMGWIESIEFVSNKKKCITFDCCVALEQNCHLVTSWTEPEDVENIVNALTRSAHRSDDWPIAEKNLLVYACSSYEGDNYPFDGLENYLVSSSNDGKFSMFTSWYYNGGNGWGSTNEITFVRYKTDEHTYVIPFFIAWIFEGEEQAHGNFPYIETQAVYSIKTPIGAIYIVEMDFVDRSPAYDSKEHRIDNTCVIGAFRIK